MQEPTAHDISRQRKYVRTLGAGLLVEVDHNSTLMLHKRYSEPTKATGVRAHTINRSIDYEGAVYDRNGSQFTPDEKLDRGSILSYDQIWTQLGRLDKGEVLVINPILKPVGELQVKEAGRERGRAQKRRKRLDRLAGGDD